MSLYLPRVFVFLVMWLWDQELLTMKSIFFMCQTRSANKPDSDSDLLISLSLKTLIRCIKRKLYLCAEGRRGSVWPVFLFFHKQSVNSTIKHIPSPKCLLLLPGKCCYDSPSMQEKWEPEPVKLIRDLRVEERQQATDIIHAVHLEEDIRKNK